MHFKSAGTCAPPGISAPRTVGWVERSETHQPFANQDFGARAQAREAERSGSRACPGLDPGAASQNLDAPRGGRFFDDKRPRRAVPPPRHRCG